MKKFSLIQIFKIARLAYKFIRAIQSEEENGKRLSKKEKEDLWNGLFSLISDIMEK